MLFKEKLTFLHIQTIILNNLLETAFMVKCISCLINIGPGLSNYMPKSDVSKEHIMKIDIDMQLPNGGSRLTDSF